MTQLHWYLERTREPLWPDGLVHHDDRVYMGGYGYPSPQKPETFQVFRGHSLLVRAVIKAKFWSQQRPLTSLHASGPTTEGAVADLYLSRSWEPRRTKKRITERWVFSDDLNSPRSAELRVPRQDYFTRVSKFEVSGQGGASPGGKLALELNGLAKKDPVLTMMLPWDPTNDLRDVLREEAELLADEFDLDSPYETILDFLGPYLLQQPQGWSFDLPYEEITVHANETVTRTVLVTAGDGDGVAFAIQSSDPRDIANPDLPSFSDVYVISRDRDFRLNLLYGDPA